MLGDVFLQSSYLLLKVIQLSPIMHLNMELGQSIISTKVITEIKNNVYNGHFLFTLKRKPNYIILNVFLPISFLCIWNILVFLLPTESGERISYSITVMLSIAVYMTIVSSALPKSSEPVPLISYFTMICLALSALITIVAVMNIRLFYKASGDVPDLLLYIYQKLSFSSNCRCKKRKENGTDEKQRGMDFVTDVIHKHSNKSCCRHRRYM